jgi:WD40 repeat protein
MAFAHGSAAVATGGNQVLIISNGETKETLKTTVTPTAVALAPNGATLAVGQEDGKIQLYQVPGLKPVAVLESNRGQITCLAYSPKGDLLAAGDTQRNVLVYDTVTNQVKIDQWVFHSARVNCVGWSPDGEHACSGSLDTNIEIWSVKEPMKHIAIKNAHLESVTGVAFLDNELLVSAGADASIKVYSVIY